MKDNEKDLKDTVKASAKPHLRRSLFISPIKGGGQESRGLVASGRDGVVYLEDGSLVFFG